MSRILSLRLIHAMHALTSKLKIDVIGDKKQDTGRKISEGTCF